MKRFILFFLIFLSTGKLFAGTGTVQITTTTSTSGNTQFYISTPTLCGTSALSIDANGNIGIGTTSSVSDLGVNSTTVIGSGYAGVKTAPADGLLVQGNIGIGTTSPGAKLDISASGKTYGLCVSSGVLFAANSGSVGISTGTLNSTLDINGSLSLEELTLNPATPYSALLTDCIIIFATNGSKTVNLPSATRAPGKVYFIKDLTGNGKAVTVAVQTGDSIEGTVNGTFSIVSGRGVMIVCNGTNWNVVGN